MIVTIDLPFSVNVLVKVGDKVDFQTPLIKEKKSKDIKLNVSEKLGLSPNKIFRSLKKFVGDEIKKDELLAEKSSFFDHKKLLSEFEGVLREINHKDGTILIEIKSEEEKTVNCFFKGEIVEIGHDQIKLKVAKNHVFIIKDVINCSEECGGEVYYLKSKEEIARDQVAGKFIFYSEKINSYEQTKFEALGAKGFISQHSLPEKTGVFFCKLKQIADFEKVTKLQLPYCIIDKKESKIIFYQ